MILVGVALSGFPAAAWALPGYSNLINSYCQAQGNARLSYTDNGCTLCHHAGTFVSDPAHRAEPQWSEFEIGRSAGGDYRFFCPPNGGAPQLAADPPISDAEAIAGAGPADDASAHASMSWMSLGYPSGHPAAVVEQDSATGNDPDRTAKPVAARKPTVSAAVATQSLAPPQPEAGAAAERKSKLDKLRAELGIGRAQDVAWQELADAVLAVGPEPVSSLSKSSTGAELGVQLQDQQRRLAQRSAQLRAVNTALIRLNAQLDEPRQRLLAARLPGLFGDSGSKE